VFRLINKNMTVIDHITITAPTLEAGAKLVKDSLGVSLQKGGKHPRMGTHNLLLRLGDSLFLEVIACDPKAEKPKRPRWFALDEINNNTPAMLKTWVVRTNDIHTNAHSCAESPGNIEPMSRGKTQWLITIPDDGSLPIDGGAPALIQWQNNDSHPASKLKNYGLSLVKIQIYHPEPKRLLRFLSSINLKDNVDVVEADETRFIATISTPTGVKTLGN
jgi:hypothetical protein